MIKTLLNTFGLIILLCSMYPHTLNAKVLLEQGDIQVDESDMLGFSLSIPEDKRSDFFNSPARIGQTLETLLTMKHITKYGLDKKLFSEVTIEENVKNEMSYFNAVYTNNKLLKDYLTLRNSYKETLKQLKKMSKVKDVEELAKEHYTINVDRYKNEEKRDVEYINFVFTEKNKDKIEIKANEVLTKLTSKKRSFDDIIKANSEDVNFEYIEGLNDFKFNKKYIQFSKFVYTVKTKGIIPKILVLNNRFTIVNILEIKKAYLSPYDEVKELIIHKLLANKASRDIENLLRKLTSDEISINKEGISMLRDNFINNSF